MKKNKSPEYFRIGRIPISVTNQRNTCERIKQLIRERQKGYVCISNMRTVVIANNDKAYLDVVEHSLFNAPDGTPLVWCGKAWGIKEVERACGPHLFDDLIEDKDPILKHFLLGDTGETEQRLKEKCEKEYGTQITGMYSPPFVSLDEYDIEEIARRINDSGANIVWTSLRAPKQDILNARLLPYLNDGIVMIGIGAAFRYKLGELKSPDGILQKMGLAGLLFVRKGSTFKGELMWYIKHSYYLLKYLISIYLKRLTGRSCIE